MLITKLINNLKCLTTAYQDLLLATDTIEPTLDSYFQIESILIEASDDDSCIVRVIEIPEQTQIISILLMRVGDSGFDDIESIFVDEYTVSIANNIKTLNITTCGTHSINDYELQVIYRLL